MLYVITIVALVMYATLARIAYKKYKEIKRLVSVCQDTLIDVITPLALNNTKLAELVTDLMTKDPTSCYEQ
jgi:hypothetical protein